MDAAGFNQRTEYLSTLERDTSQYFETLSELSEKAVWGPDTAEQRGQLEFLIKETKARIKQGVKLSEEAVSAAISFLSRWTKEYEGISPMLQESWWDFEILACGDFATLAHLQSPKVWALCQARALAVAASKFDALDTSVFRGLEKLSQNYPGEVKELLLECLKLALEKGSFLSQAALAGTFARIGSADDGPQLLKAFEHLVDCSRHAQTQNAGSFAITLAYFGAKECSDTLIAWRDENASLWGDSKHWAQTAYASWMLGEQKEIVLDSLRDDSSRKGLIPYLACAAADLGMTDALPSLRELLKNLDNPVSKEAVKEAICRLEASGEPAEPQDWMIWMLGTRHPTEIALGAESDNIFAQRAQAAADSEADASLADD